MPVDCPYYREYRRALREDERSIHERIAWVTVPYCLHKHSPAPLGKVGDVQRGWLVLKCGGSVDHCQVPIRNRLDIE